MASALGDRAARRSSAMIDHLLCVSRRFTALPVLPALALMLPALVSPLVIAGCVLTTEEGDRPPPPPPPGAPKDTCQPSRAAGAVSAPQKALHDVIAWAEGTRGRSRDGYDVMFAFEIAASCVSHPNVCTKFGSTCSTAAGRYQFLHRTWTAAASARDLDTFEPENQERAAEYLISTVRRVSVPQDRAMTASELANAMEKLSYEWASLPPARYGQSAKSPADVRATYCSFAGC